MAGAPDTPLREQAAALRDPAQRARLVQEATTGPYRTPIGAETRPPDYDVLRVLEGGDHAVRTVSGVAAARRVEPIDALIDLSLEADFDCFFGQPFANQDMDQVLRILKDPHVVVGSSDSGAHVSQIIDSSIPTFLLSYWVRDRQAFTWEEGIRKLTFDPAMAFGFTDRGLTRRAGPPTSSSSTPKGWLPTSPTLTPTFRPAPPGSNRRPWALTPPSSTDRSSCGTASTPAGYPACCCGGHWGGATNPKCNHSGPLRAPSTTRRNVARNVGNSARRPLSVR